MLKHYSHIRMEAKRSALEAIVRKPSSASESQQGYPQKSPPSPQNGGKDLETGHSPEGTDNSNARKNGARDCSESDVITQNFEGESLQKSLKLANFEGHRGVYRRRKLLKKLAPQVGLEPSRLIQPLARIHQHFATNTGKIKGWGEFSWLEPHPLKAPKTRE
jgi:hypothetical protein